jgi:hypothetical protein
MGAIDAATGIARPPAKHLTPAASCGVSRLRGSSCDRFDPLNFASCGHSLS